MNPHFLNNWYTSSSLHHYLPGNYHFSIFTNAKVKNFFSITIATEVSLTVDMKLIDVNGNPPKKKGSHGQRRGSRKH